VTHKSDSRNKGQGLVVRWEGGQQVRRRAGRKRRGTQHANDRHIAERRERRGKKVKDESESTQRPMNQGIIAPQRKKKMFKGRKKGGMKKKQGVNVIKQKKNLSPPPT